MSQLQLLTLKFEDLKMFEDESIPEFNIRVLNIANESITLGKKILDTKLVIKILHSLLQCFSMKVTTTEEVNDIVSMKLDELFWFLENF